MKHDKIIYFILFFLFNIFQQTNIIYIFGRLVHRNEDKRKVRHLNFIYFFIYNLIQLLYINFGGSSKFTKCYNRNKIR